MFRFIALLPFVAMLHILASAQSGASDGSALNGTNTAWQNEAGSTMSLTVDADGAVTGTYVNRASGTGCQFSPYPIIGQVNGDFIAFVVAWDNSTANCNSVTAWSGYVLTTGSAAQIQTRWNIAYQGSSKPAIAQGQDTFTQTSKQIGAAFIDGDAELSLTTIRR